MRAMEKELPGELAMPHEVTSRQFADAVFAVSTSVYGG
mgnify:CR=1 FL=1